MTKQDIIGLIVQDEIGTAIKAIQIATNTSNDIILQSSRWNGLQRDVTGGTISDENARLTKNKIVAGLLSIARSLPDDVMVEGIEIPVTSDTSSPPNQKSSSKQTKVFISYNHKDKLEATRIRNYFREKGIPVTIDSEAMKAGEDIRSFINRCIRETTVTISLVSTNSLMSAWVGMESLNTMVGEQIADKQFIACAIETTFFERSFVRTAVEKINLTLEEIDDEVKWRLENNVGMEDLQNERSRYNDLKSKLPTIVANLKERLTIDITGENFEPGMNRIVETITS